MCVIYQVIFFVLTLKVVPCGGETDNPALVPDTPSDVPPVTASPVNKDAPGKSPQGSDDGAVVENDPLTDDKGGQPITEDAFKEAFEQTVLQYEVTDGSAKKTHSSQALLDNTQTSYFYFEGDYLVFDLDREGKAMKRSELRQYPDWKVAGEHVMAAVVNLQASPLNEYTWMQLHRKEPLSVKPPLRLTWEKNLEINGTVYKDYLVAVFYHGSKGYKKVPLMPRPDNNFSAELRAYNHQVFITLNGELVHVENVSGWGKYDCYFKAGLYASGSEEAYGNAKVKLLSLSFSHKS